MVLKEEVEKVWERVKVERCQKNFTNYSLASSCFIHIQSNTEKIKIKSKEYVTIEVKYLIFKKQHGGGRRRLHLEGRLTAGNRRKC